MRTLILTVFVVATIAFVLTDPRWSGGLATPIAASWQSTAIAYGESEGARVTQLGPEERCAFAGRWLAEREGRGEVVQRAEMAAVERVMASCHRLSRDGSGDRDLRGSDRSSGRNFAL